MERKTFGCFASKSKKLTPSPSSKTLKLAASAVLTSKSTNESPAQIRPVKRKIPMITKQHTVAYTDWELFKANRELKSNASSKVVHDLRRKIKNPHIYVNGTNIDHDQKMFESHLFKAFRNIHKD